MERQEAIAPLRGSRPATARWIEECSRLCRAHVEISGERALRHAQRVVFDAQPKMINTAARIAVGECF
jgi:hypothetical protein